MLIKKIIIAVAIFVIPINVIAQSNNFDQQLYKAAEYAMAGSHLEAEKILTNLLSDIKRVEGRSLYYAETMVLLAGVYKGQNKFEQAIAMYNEALEIFEKDDVVHIDYLYLISHESGEIAFDLGDYENALKSYERNMEILALPQFEYQADAGEHWCEEEEYCSTYAKGAEIALKIGQLDKAEKYSSSAVLKYRSLTGECLKTHNSLNYLVYNSALEVVLTQWKLSLDAEDYLNARHFLYQSFALIEESQNYTLALALSEVYSNYDKFAKLQSKNDISDLTNTFDTFISVFNKGFEEAFIKGSIPSMEAVVSQKSYTYNTAAIVCQNLGLIQAADNYYQKAVDILEKGELNLDDNSLLGAYAAFKQEYCNDYASSLSLYWKGVQEKIKKYGEYNERALEAFDEMYVSFKVSMGYIHANTVANPEGSPRLSYEEYNSIITIWKDIISSLSDEYGYDYLKYLQEYCDKKKSLLLKEKNGNEWKERLDYYTYGESKPKKPNLDLYASCLDIEAKLNILEGCSFEYEKNIKDLFDYQQSITDKYDLDDLERTWAEEILDLSDLLKRVGQYESALHLLLEWSIHENEKEYPRYDLIERFNTKIAIEALNMGDREMAIACSMQSIPFSQNISSYKYLVKNFYDDINEYLTQLSVQCDLYYSPQGLQLDLEQALEYAEFANNLIQDDCRGRNGKPVTPVIKSMVYNMLGVLYMSNTDYASAEHFYKKALAIDDEFGVWQIAPHAGLASILVSQEKYEEAEIILKECINKAKENTFSELALRACYDNLAFAAQQQGHWTDFAAYLATEFEIEKASYIKNTQGLTSKSRQNYWDSNQYMRIGPFSHTSAAEMSSLVNGTAYDALLFHKHLLVRQARIIEENILNSADSEMQKEFNLYKEAIRSGDIDEATLHENAVMHLYSNHPEFLASFKHLSWTDVQENLNENDIAIEFTEVADHNDRINKYAAFIIKKGMTLPKLIKLCAAQQLDDLIAKMQSKEGYSAAYSLSDNNENVLYSMIWKQLEPELKGIKRIFFSPAGILHQINIEILSKNKKSDRICEKYEVHRLSSTALLCEKELSPQFTSATLFGGLDYNTSLSSSNAMGATKSTFEHFPIDKESITRGRGVSWLYLGETVTEVETIGTYLSSKGIKTKIITQEEGTEETFKRLSGNSTSILHLATHGFYYSDEEYRKLSISEEEKSSSFISPLKRSGLILSGANHLWRGRDIPQGTEDGTLTADEIAGMDLTSTQLLVLSACQTGLGDVRSDGVYGLQHGFKLAGVQTIIMSLWEVSSSATEIMMTTFYNNLMSGKSKYESFINAQKQVRSTFTKSYIQKNLAPTAPQDPEYYWASFIMVD